MGISTKNNEELIKIYYNFMYNKDVSKHLSTLDIGAILNHMYTNKGLFNDINYQEESLQILIKYKY